MLNANSEKMTENTTRWFKAEAQGLQVCTNTSYTQTLTNTHSFLSHTHTQGLTHSPTCTRTLIRIHTAVRKLGP